MLLPMQQNKAFTELNHETAIILAEGLQENSTLHTLDISANLNLDLKDEIDTLGVHTLFHAIKAHTTLKKLDLGCSNSKIVPLVAGIITTNTVLTLLTLRKCSLGIKHAEMLSKSMQYNTSLATLDLRDNTSGLSLNSTIALDRRIIYIEEYEKDWPTPMPIAYRNALDLISERIRY